MQNPKSRYSERPGKPEPGPRYKRVVPEDKALTKGAKPSRGNDKALKDEGNSSTKISNPHRKGIGPCGKRADRRGKRTNSHQHYIQEHSSTLRMASSSTFISATVKESNGRSHISVKINLQRRILQYHAKLTLRGTKTFLLSAREIEREMS